MGIHIQVLYLEGGFEMKFHLPVLCCLVITAIGKKPNKVTAGDELKIQRGTIRDTILHWGPSWSVKFNLTALRSNLTFWYKYNCSVTTQYGAFGKYHNIINLSKGGTLGRPDARIRLPAFFLKPSGEWNFAYLTVAYNPDGPKNNLHDYKLTLDKEYEIEGRLEGKKFYLFVDGKEQFTAPAPSAKEEDNVILYQSDPWEDSAYSDPNNKPELQANMCKVPNLQLTSEGKEVVLKPTNENKCPA